MRGPVKWLINDDLVSHEHNDPFHILLLDATYAKNDRIMIKYVATSCAYVLLMPYDEATELAAHAKSDGLVCRVMPFCKGGTGRGRQGMQGGENAAVWSTKTPV